MFAVFVVLSRCRNFFRSKSHFNDLLFQEYHFGTHKARGGNFVFTGIYFVISI